MAASTQLHTSYWIEHGYIGVGLMEMMRTLGSGLGHGEGGVWKPSLHLSDSGLNTFTVRRSDSRPARQAARDKRQGNVEKTLSQEAV